MIITRDPDEWVTTTKQRTCEYHKQHPGKSYAGCVCSGSWGERRATPEEYKANKIKRLETRADELKQELHETLLELGLVKHGHIWKELAKR